MERNRKGEDFMEYVIETQNLCKSYRGKAAVSSLNMHVQKGDIYGFIGRNGAGKSTIMNALQPGPSYGRKHFSFWKISGYAFRPQAYGGSD